MTDWAGPDPVGGEAGLKFPNFVHGPAQAHGLAGRARASYELTRVLCCLFFGFLTVLD